MRIPRPRSQALVKDPPDRHFRTLPNRVAVWNASVSNLIQLLNLTLLPNYLSGSRTSGIKNLRATVSARRLCGN
jgi:hypothetical protein